MADVVADFVADITVGTIPFTVTFTDTSTGAPLPNHWWWDFGDGERGSSLQNPTHTYLYEGEFSVTLTAWYNDDGATPVGEIYGLVQSTREKFSGYYWTDEVAAWNAFLAAEETVVAPSSFYAYGFQGSNSGLRYSYVLKESIIHIDLTAYTQGQKVIMLRYRSRFFDYLNGIGCAVSSQDPLEQWWVDNYTLNDIPMLKRNTRADAYHLMQMISSPDLLPEYDHAGETFVIECGNGKNTLVPLPDDTGVSRCQGNALYQQNAIVEGVSCPRTMNHDITLQRLGISCIYNSDNGFAQNRSFSLVGSDAVSARIYSFDSLDTKKSAGSNFITANSNMIARPAVLYSGIKESYFPDYWRNEKYLYVEQEKAHPCSVQFIDIYADTENDE